jgi:hypothetical protein
MVVEMVFRVTDAYISLNDWYISLSAFGWVGGGREGILTNKHQMHIDPDEQPDGVVLPRHEGVPRPRDDTAA